MTIDRIDDTALSVVLYSPVCSECVNRVDFRKCRAFDEIPLDIWEGRNDHRQPFEGDNGIQFEQRP